MKLYPTTLSKLLMGLGLFLIGWAEPFCVFAQDIKVLDSLHNLLQKEDIADSSKAHLLSELAIQLAEVDTAKAFSYSRQALELSKRAKYAYGEAFALHAIGYVYDCQFMTADALSYYEQSIALKEKINDQSGISASLANIGMLHYYGGQAFDKALQYLDLALQKRRSIGDSLGVASIYNNMAIVCRRLKQYDKALAYYQSSLRIKEAAGDLKGIAASYSNLSTLYQYTHEYDKALDYEQKALKIEEQRGNLRDCAHSLMSIGHIYYWKETYAPARAYIGKALLISDSIGAADISARGYAALSEIDSLQGNTSGALVNYKRYIYYKEKVFAEKQQARFAVLQAIYESEKKDRTLEQNKQTLALLEQQNIAQTQSIRFWVLLFLSTLGIISFLVYQQNQKKKSYRLLEDKNKVIAAALAEKELFLREIHHRVKNNLQIVSGLLSWQSELTDDESLKRTVTEGKNRLKSMAMIHQRLYSNDDVKNISVQDYINELSEEIADSYGLDASKIQIKTDIDPIFIDVDTMIPLGLIITELISNAIKHAFPNQQGEIKVALKKSEKGLLLQVADNGIGLHPSPNEEPKKKSFGLRLVETMAQKLEAVLNIDRRKGTIISLEIKL